MVAVVGRRLLNVIREVPPGGYEKAIQPPPPSPTKKPHQKDHHMLVISKILWGGWEGGAGRGGLGSFSRTPLGPLSSSVLKSSF